MADRGLHRVAQLLNFVVARKKSVECFLKAGKSLVTQAALIGS
jgi:hypothetical protein